MVDGLCRQELEERGRAYSHCSMILVFKIDYNSATPLISCHHHVCTTAICTCHLLLQVAGMYVIYPSANMTIKPHTIKPPP